MILFAILAEVSVGRMLLAGVLPGLVLALALLVCVYWLIASGRVKAPPVEPMMGREKARVVLEGLPAVLAPVVLVGGLVSGIVTTTEAGVAACVYSLLVALIFYRELTWARFRQVMTRAVLSSGLVMALIGAGSVLAWIITWDQGAEAVGRWFAGLTDQLWAQLLLINVFLLIVGCLIEGVPALLILIPILMPMAQNLGVDPVHFGVIMIFNLLVGLVTPPVGLGLYVMANVTGLSVERVIRSTIPFFVPLIAALLFVTFVPWLSLFLPRLLLP
jgi:tripartite ATP-independent transporter DctM subunit